MNAHTRVPAGSRTRCLVLLRLDRDQSFAARDCRSLGSFERATMGLDAFLDIPQKYSATVQRHFFLGSPPLAPKAELAKSRCDWDRMRTGGVPSFLGHIY